MRQLKQSTAYNCMVFMTDSADHISGKTSLTLTITASKDGGAFSGISPTVTDLGSGWYSLALTTTHTNTVGDLVLHITGTGADPTDVAMQVLTEVAPDNTSIAAIKAKTDNLPSDPADASDIAAAFGTVNTTLGTIAGYIDTEVAAIKAKTDNLPSDPADQSAVEAAITAAFDSLDGKLDDVKAQTDLIPATPAGRTYARNVAVNKFPFVMFNSSGDPTDGLSPVVNVSLDGAAFAPSANAAVEISDGWYYVDLTAGEMDAKNVALRISAPGGKETTVMLPTEEV